jgi:hypothetical protein
VQRSRLYPTHALGHLQVSVSTNSLPPIKELKLKGF